MRGKGLMADLANEDKRFSMVQEACDLYVAKPLADGGIEVRIIIPPRFADLWLVKLSELTGTLAEVRHFLIPQTPRIYSGPRKLDH